MPAHAAEYVAVAEACAAGTFQFPVMAVYVDRAMAYPDQLDEAQPTAEVDALGREAKWLGCIARGAAVVPAGVTAIRATNPSPPSPNEAAHPALRVARVHPPHPLQPIPPLPQRNESGTSGAEYPEPTAPSMLRLGRKG